MALPVGATVISTLMVLFAACNVPVASGFHVHLEVHDLNMITCYTCPGMANNSQCNKWAPDVPCPVEGAVCKTVHSMSRDTGSSVHVVKSCSLPEHCKNEHVGCKLNEDGEMVCTSCCTRSYCNVAVPYNVSTSMLLSKDLVSTSGSGHVIPVTWYVAIATVVLQVFSRV